MEYLFLIIGIIAFLCFEWVLDNILWIGGIFILLLIISIIRVFPDYKECGFDFGEFMILMLKLAGIVGTILLICYVQNL